MRDLSALHPARLEVGPGLRPRLPIPGTVFLDISDPAVAKLRAADGKAQAGDVTALPFEDGRFGLVCACDIIEHVANDAQALAEVARVTAPGGVLVISVPLHASRWTEFDGFVGHFHRYEPAELLSRLTSLGFQVERSAGYGMQPRSTHLVNFGMRMLRSQRKRAMWWYNHIFMPIGLWFQEDLRLHDGVMDTDPIDQILLVCRKAG